MHKGPFSHGTTHMAGDMDNVTSFLTFSQMIKEKVGTNINTIFAGACIKALVHGTTHMAGDMDNVTSS